jgi:predicted ATPase/class 3 adenylate cyclase
VTFLFTDVEDSTGWWDRHPVEMRQALERHDRIVQEVMAVNGGFVFSRGGDGVAVAFQRAGDAVAAAVDAQRVLLSEDWPARVELRVRMGVHTGEADERDGDYFGPPLNRAARLMTAAHGGQILVSATTAEMLWSVTGIELVDQGLLALRGISDLIHAFGIAADGVPWVECEPRTVRTLVGKLPAPVTEWFGSVAELRRRVSSLPSRRLVTLTGPGGVGKTRRALEAAALAADEFRDGVWLVELAPLADPSGVAPAVAATLSIQPQPGVSVVEAIADWLRDRRLLLVLDNCEHLLAAAGDLASAIVTRCPTVTVLATSRESLGIDGERVVPLSGLGTADAVDLFCDRVSAVDDTVTLSAHDQRAVVAICEQLDGIPLAIELAAARLRSMTLTEVLQRLGDRLRLLRSSSRRGLERHRTLQATVDWSYRLLTGSEQLLFDRLSVFAGGFDLAAVEAVCAGPPLARADVFDLLASLVDKSMVVADRADDATRYRLLETLRQFAAERVGDGDVGDELRERHLRHYIDVAQAARRQWTSPRQLTADDIFEREWDNLRAAHVWAVTVADVHAADGIVAATGWHAQTRGRHEHGDWAQRTLELESTGLRPASSTYKWASFAAVDAGDIEAAVRLAERGIDAAPWPDHRDAAQCWGDLIRAQLALSRDNAAVEAAHHLATIESTVSDPVENWIAVRGLIGNALANDPASMPGLVDSLAEQAGQIGAPSILSETARYQALSALYAEHPRDPERVFAAAQEGVVLAQSVRDLLNECGNLYLLAMAAVALDRPDAGAICRDALSRTYDLRFWPFLWLELETVAGYFAEGRSFDAAAVLYGHLEAHHPPWGMPAARRARQRGLDRARQLADFESLMAQGADMDRDEVVAYALERLEETAAPQVDPV